MAYEKDPNEIGALWVKTSASGKEYMSGTIAGIGAVVCFRVKKQTDKGPTWNVLKSQPRDDATSTRQRDNREAPRRASRVDDPSERTYDEDGF